MKIVTPQQSGLPPLLSRATSPNLEQYKLLMSRRQSFTQMIWQLPVLTTGASGFLITKAAETSGDVVGIAVALLSVIISLASLQLLARHRMNERIDTQLIRLFENSNPDYVRTVAEKGGNNELYLQVFGEKIGFFSSIPSGNLWRLVMIIVSIISVIVVFLKLISAYYEILGLSKRTPITLVSLL